LRDGANSAPDADAHFAFVCRDAQLAHKPGIASLPHRGVEINDVDQRVTAKAVEQAENIVHGELPLASVDKLDGASILQINARNEHVE
jgi:hypothetical protein